MAGEPVGGLILAHSGSHAGARPGARYDRQGREEREAATLTEGATRADGAGARLRSEEPDAIRTCFERDRDRILHASAFRRL
ncbi:MAG: deoxyguanosinetriphosphate triphosphohydrolase, partial [Acidimicrobiales bacterium]